MTEVTTRGVPGMRSVADLPIAQVRIDDSRGFASTSRAIAVGRASRARAGTPRRRRGERLDSSLRGETFESTTTDDAPHA